MITVSCRAINNGIETLTTALPSMVYRVEYYLEGVRVSSIESSDITICLREVEQKMRMDMGHLKGKVFTTRTGKEI